MRIRWCAVNVVDALLVLSALLAVTVGLGVFLRWQQNRPRRRNPDEIIDPRRLGATALGERATLLQFSTQTCGRCPGVHRTLGEIARERAGVLHLDIDLTDRPDIAQHFHVLQTPTTFVLDGRGTIHTRFGGAPSRGVVELELDRVLAPRVPA